MKENTEVEKKSIGMGWREKKIEFNRPEPQGGKATEASCGNSFTISGARLLKEWRKRRSCMYVRREDEAMRIPFH